jgi:hypothetical protein
MNANHSLITLKTYFSVFLKYFGKDQKYEYFIVILNENERMSHLCAMACFADGLPLVEPGRRQLVEGVPDWVHYQPGNY